MNRAIVLTLLESVDDPTLPRQNEIILHLLKAGNGTGVACLGIDPVLGATEYPEVTIVKGKGKLYADPLKGQQISSNTISTFKGTYITCEEECYVSITNAHNIARFLSAGSTWIGRDARHFFSRLDANAPEINSPLSALLPAINLNTINCWDYLKDKTNIKGDVSHLSQLEKLQQFSIDQCAFITGDISELFNFDTGKLSIVDASNAYNLQGSTNGINLSTASRLLLNGTQVISSFADLVSLRRNIQLDISLGENSSGDLSELPIFTNLSIGLGFVPNYTRNVKFRQNSLRGLSFSKAVPLALFENLCADLNDANNVTYKAGASIRLHIQDSDIASVSQGTKDHIQSIVAKGVVFSTNISIA